MQFKTKYLYLILAIVGTILPYYFMSLVILEHQGFDFLRFWEEINRTNSSRFINSDLTVTGLTFLTFIYFDSRIHKVKRWWLSILAVFAVGISLAFPLYLYLREDSLS